MGSGKFAFVLSAVAAFALTGVQAQVTTNATCTSQYSWMLNHRGQSPCVVSAYLSAQCNAGQWNVPSITPTGPQYLPPHDAGANICRCNTVLYSLLQGCSTCQGGTSGTWTAWIANCASNQVFIQQYPLAIPNTVNIPAWAFLNVVPANNFDVNMANSFRNAPESTGVGSPTATVVTGKQIPTTTGVPVPTKGNSGGGSKSSTNVGAIVGGIIAGLVVLGLIAGGIIFYMKKQQRKKSASGPGYIGNDAPQFSQVPQTPLAYPNTPGTPGPKPYDPNDPSTFPVTPAPGYALPYSPQPTGYAPPLQQPDANYYAGSDGRPQTIYSNQSQYPQGPPQQTPYTPGYPQQQVPHQPGGYSGAAEL